VDVFSPGYEGDWEEIMTPEVTIFADGRRLKVRENTVIMTFTCGGERTVASVAIERGVWDRWLIEQLPEAMKLARDSAQATAMH
jgi:hypothetical protein